MVAELRFGQVEHTDGHELIFAKNINSIDDFALI